MYNSLYVVAAIVTLCVVFVDAGRMDRYRSLRYRTYITGSRHELAWDFTNRRMFFELTMQTQDPVIGMGFSDHGETWNADFMVSWLDEDGNRHLQDTWTDSYSIMHADVHQSFEVDGMKELRGERGVTIRFSRERRSCDLQDYHIDTGTTHVLTFSSSSHFYTAEMVNTSSLNVSVTRVQILKSQQPLGDMPDDSEFIEVTNNMVRVPETETMYWCSVHKLPTMRRKKHIIKYAGVINSTAVHHMEVFSCQLSPKTLVPYYSGPCDQKPRVLSACSKVIGAWAMGADSFTYPEQAGVPIGDTVDSGYVVLEIHYNNPEILPGIVDSSGIRFTVTSRLREFDAAIMELGVTYDSRGSIPPRQDKFYLEGVCSDSCTDQGLPDDGITVFASQLHTHLAGVRVRTMHIRNGIQLSDISADKHYSPHFQEIRILPQPVKVLPGDSLITECEYTTLLRDNVTLGGFAISEEMCVSYIHYYPKTSLEVCKGTISNSAVQRFFTMMAYYMSAKTNAFNSVPDNFRAMKWNPVNSRLLQWFYDTMPIDVECKKSDGSSFSGHWGHLTKPRVWLSERYNPREEHECDETEKARFYRTNYLR